MSQKIIYVHCGRFSEFQDFQKRHPEYVCIMIHDGNTLRGRTPGEIRLEGTYYEKWNDHEIQESIDYYRERWEKELIKQELNSSDDKSDQDMDSYGV